MIGPLKLALGGFKYVYVTIDKFFKWIKYKPLVIATMKKAANLFEDIIYRFSLPNGIIIDLSPTFTNNDFWDFLRRPVHLYQIHLVTTLELMAC